MDDKLIELIAIIIGVFVMVVLDKMDNHLRNRRTNTIRDVSGNAIGTEDYVHPCLGQCKDPNLILNKSPTPMYKHNCRAPCFFASRSGRYYRGKQRKRTW